MPPPPEIALGQTCAVDNVPTGVCAPLPLCGPPCCAVAASTTRAAIGEGECLEAGAALASDDLSAAPWRASCGHFNGDAIACARHFIYIVGIDSVEQLLIR